jgi:uncharacterized protein (TIGR03083 family)
MTTSCTLTAWSHDEAVALAEAEYDRIVGVLESLDAEDWDRATDCEGWTVRDLAGHVVGSMRAAAAVRVLARQQLGAHRRAKADGGDPTDHMTAIQVEETAALSTAELVSEARRLVSKATAGRRRTPGPVRRHVRFPVLVGGTTEQWTVGWLVDVCLTRDAWLHRIDLCRAVGREPELTPDHDGRIVADVVDEWARRHGRPFHLVLTGPAGGRFGDPGAGEAIELDAVELCRILSGRASGPGLLTTEVPF